MSSFKVRAVQIDLARQIETIDMVKKYFADGSKEQVVKESISCF